MRRRTSRAWLRRRLRCTAGSPTSSICRGRSRSSPSASARSTFTACTRISGSSSRSSSRRSSGGTCGRWSRARPVRGLGDDARPVPRVGLRRGRGRRRGVQLPAHAGEDGALRPRSGSRPTCATRSAGSAGRAPRPRGYVARVVRSAGGCRAPALPLARRRVRARGCPSRRARARGAVGAAHHALRSRLPARAPARAVLVLQAPPRVRSRARRRRSSSPATSSTRSSGSRRSRRCERAARGAEVVHADSTDVVLDGALRRDPHLAAVSGTHRLPRAAPIRVRASRPRRSSRPRARRRRARDEQACSRGLRRRDLARPRRAVGAHSSPDAPVIVVVNDRRDLYPAILERSGLRLVDRLERHVNRRTGRRAGEYFESVLVCVRET